MFVLMSQLLRFLLVVLILRIALRGLVSDVPGPRGVTPIGSPGSARPRAQARLGVDLVKDRICNTYVPRDRALPRWSAGRRSISARRNAAAARSPEPPEGPPERERTARLTPGRARFRVRAPDPPRRRRNLWVKRWG